jgi:hypothetical protein
LSGVRAVTVAAVLAAGCSGAGTGGDAAGLAGAWAVSEVAVSSADTSFTITAPRPGLFVFTRNHFSAVVIVGEGPLEPFSDEPTDAERLTAFRNLRATAARYELGDSTMTITTFVDAIPSDVGDTFTAGYRLDDRMLVLTFHDDQGGTTTITLTRMPE